MHEQTLSQWLDQVRQGRVPRRTFIERALALGLSLPMAGTLLMDAAPAQAQPAGAFRYKPTKRGGGGTLRLLLWQGPTLLNPHFATGTKDELGCGVFYESLAQWDVDGNLVPVLAAEVPSRENGGLAADLKSVVWKLKRGVTWHDGQPFSADDVVFNWQYATDPATAAVTSGSFTEVQRFEKVDSHAIRVVFKEPSPFWPGLYCSVPIVPRHLFAPYSGAKSRDNPVNLKPVGTGPFKFVDFKPGDLVRGEINTAYHEANKPHFDVVDIKGGGDAASAARAVLQTGEFDYAWNLLVEDDILKRLEAGGKGRVVMLTGGTMEALYLNYADPGKEVDGERSAPGTRHPLWQDAALRQAMALLVDRQGMQDFIYGRAGQATANYINVPAQFRSGSLSFEFNVDKANAILDAAGYRRGPDGVREKNGRKLRFLFQTSVNGSRQKCQAMVKQACQKAGIDLELKAVTASVFFSSDVANPDTNTKFYADMQMFANGQGRPDPTRHLQRFVSWEVCSKANKWLGVNVSRWKSDEYDRLYKLADGELDPVKRAALVIQMNDIVCRDGYVIPLLLRQEVAALANKVQAPLSGWSNSTTRLRDWYRDA